MEFSLPFFEKLKIVARHPSFLLLFLYRHDHRIDDLIDFLMEGFERITSIEKTSCRLVIKIDGNSYEIWAANRFYAYATRIDCNWRNTVSERRPSLSHALLFWYVFDKKGAFDFLKPDETPLIAEPR